MISTVRRIAYVMGCLFLSSLSGQSESPRPQPPKISAQAPLKKPEKTRTLEKTRTPEKSSTKEVSPSKGSPLSPEATNLKAALETRKDLFPETRSFYKENNFEPLWFKDKQLTDLGRKAIQVLKKADIEGLNPDDYQKAFILDQEPFTDQGEITLTNEMVHFINHVRVGRFPPGSSGHIIKVQSPKTKPVQLLQEIQKDASMVERLGPPQTTYQTLKKLLANFKELQKSHPSVPTLKDVKLKKDMTHEEVIPLRKLLIFYSDLKGNDTSNVFDSDVENALKKFQEHHTLESDGVVGPDTRKALNTSIEERINTIIVNMERWRWLPDDLGPKYIVVNVGGFEVTAVKNDAVELRIKAIVGAPITKTPLFYAPLQNIIINPDWNVPAGVMVRQKLQKLIHDPGYAYQAGMTVLDSSGNSVDPYQVDWEHEGMSYHLRQPPGARNALGRIKLNIKNPYTVYLHGTPEDKLFNRSIRGFSSGCIRLQKPVELASWVLGDDKKWSVEKIHEAIDTGSTRTVPLGAAIPVYFTYQTVWVDESNTTFFSTDHYHLDPPLMRLLKLPGVDLSNETEEEEEPSTPS